MKSFAPTELVHIDIAKLYQDMNFVMEDGTWKHFEFQSKNEGLAEGLAEGLTEATLKNARSLIGLLDEAVIAERLELPLETVLKMKEEMKEKK